MSLALQRHNSQLIQQLNEKTQELLRVKRLARRLRRRLLRIEDALQQLRTELKIAQEVIDTMREQRRCRDCGEPLFT